MIFFVPLRLYGTGRDMPWTVLAHGIDRARNRYRVNDIIVTVKILLRSSLCFNFVLSNLLQKRARLLNTLIT